MPILSALHLYPIKSCGGISLRQATATAAGLMSEQIYDREWMVVDANGKFVTQRSAPQMAAIAPRIKADTLELRAPGMLRLEIPLALPQPGTERLVSVKVWDDTVAAYDCDEVTATWFSKALGMTCRLVRFHPEARRHADAKWTKGALAPTLFADAFPYLLLSGASLADLNAKLAACGREALPLNRFRPNIVIDGVDAFEEDYAQAVRIGDAVLQPVKPCARCRIPSIDQATGIPGPNPLDLLQTYRAHPHLDGGLAFGMNAILQTGAPTLLQVGQAVQIDLDFGAM